MGNELIQRVHPEDLFAMSCAYRLHFTTENFVIGRSTFTPKRSIRGDETYIYWERLSRSVRSQEDAEDLFVSNMIGDPDRYITHYSSPAARLELKKWRRRLTEFETILAAEVRDAAIAGGWKSDGSVSEQLLNVTHRKEAITLRVENLEQVLDDRDFSFVSGDERTLALVRSRPPEVLAVLDEIILRKKGRSFLLKQWEAAPHALTYFLRCYKYKMLIPLNDFLACETARKIAAMM